MTSWVLPIRDENPTRRRAVVTLALLFVNIAVFVLIQPHGQRNAVLHLPGQQASVTLQESEGSFLYSRAAIPCEVVHRRPLSLAEVERTVDDRTATDPQNSCGKDKTARAQLRRPLFPHKSIWLAMLSSMFLHGSIMHLFGNMLFLWIFGNNVEDRWGRVWYLFFYLVGGIVATLGHTFAARNSTVPLVGASGAIAAVMGAYLVLYPKVKIRALVAIFPLRVPAWLLLGAWFISQFFVAPSEGVAWMAHVSGFVFGILVATAVKNKHRRYEPHSKLLPLQ